MKGTKTQKGITLIALIITIVVLLILAVVAISAVQESGIIRYATDAVIKQEIAIIQEKIKLKSAELILENKGETEITVEKILESYGITNSKNIRLSGDFKYISNDNEVPKVCYTLDLDKLSIDSKRGKGATEDGKSGDIFVIDLNKNVYYIIEAEIREFNPLETYIFGEKSEGKELWGGFLPADRESKYYVILSHGYTSTRYGMYKYAVLWRKLGFHCVLYDIRGHGVNKRTACTFGIKESKDLMALIADTYERYGADIHVGLHGESMGAGLQIMALEYGPKVDFIVNDCGYSEILPVLRWKVKQGFGLPGWMADVASPYGRLWFVF